MLDATARGREWLEADGVGGFASGTVGLVRTRRYHAWLLAADAAGANRFVLVSGADALVQTAQGTWPISSQAYEGDVVHPAGVDLVESFSADPWPQWIFRLPDGTRIEHQLFAGHGQSTVFASWRVIDAPLGPVTLRVRLFLACRDYHGLRRQDGAFCFDATPTDAGFLFRPFPSVPGVHVAASGSYRHEPLWYHRFHYEQEAARGFEATEDLASPGQWTFDLGATEAALVLSPDSNASEQATALSLIEAARRTERVRRAAFASPLHRAADAYVVTTRGAQTILAGYPWFTEWGRDTFISLRGLCLATGRHAQARAILLNWSALVSDGLLPNRFPDGGGRPEYNSVDAALWFVVAVYEYLAVATGRLLSKAHRNQLVTAVEDILSGYAAGTRHGIGPCPDGLLASGAVGVPLTWMDARVGDEAITPRIGKPVEVNALWLNALWVGVKLGTPSADRWRQAYKLGHANFDLRFWNEARACLYDVVDADHRAQICDGSLRPNQIFAVGGLPLTLLDATRARAVVYAVEKHLVTPVGLRSLAPDEPGYCERYEGDAGQRDRAYHQGTVWPWLMGPFVEAWVRTHGATEAPRREARGRFMWPLRKHLGEAGLGHVSEVADGVAPHRGRGCPFQAWSVGELLRLELSVLPVRLGAGEPDNLPST